MFNLADVVDFNGTEWGHTGLGDIKYIRFSIYSQFIVLNLSAGGMCVLLGARIEFSFSAGGSTLFT